MPEYDDVARAAADAATPPSLDELRSRGVRRRRRRTTGYAALAVAAIVGAAGVTGALGDRGADPDPAPAPGEQPTELVFTREDGSTFVSGVATVECVEAEDDPGVTVLRVFGSAAEPGQGPGAEGVVALEVPVEEARPGAAIRLPTEQPTFLFAADPDGNELSSTQEESSGELRIVSASCGESPSLAFTVEGVLGSELFDLPSVAVTGGLVAGGETDKPDGAEPDPDAQARAEDIIDDEHARLLDVAVSPDDPALRAAVWQACAPPPGDCRSRFALALTDDGFRTRAVAGRVFTEEPGLAAGGDRFHVAPGHQGVGWVYDTEAREHEVRPGRVAPDSTGPVVELGSGLPLPTLVDVEHATTAGLDPEALPGRTARLDRRPDGGLVALDHEAGRTEVHLSEDNGRTWRQVDVESAKGAFLDVLPRADGGPLMIVEGTFVDGGFTWAAVHELREGGAVRTEVPGGVPFAAPQLVTRDGRLLALVDGLSESVVPHGFYASAPGDWSGLERLAAGSPYDYESGREIDARALHVDAGSGRIVVSAPLGDEHAAYSSTDGGLTWEPFAAR